MLWRFFCTLCYININTFFVFDYWTKTIGSLCWSLFFVLRPQSRVQTRKPVPVLLKTAFGSRKPGVFLTFKNQWRVDPLPPICGDSTALVLSACMTRAPFWLLKICSLLHALPDTIRFYRSALQFLCFPWQFDSLIYAPQCLYVCQSLRLSHTETKRTLVIYRRDPYVLRYYCYCNSILFYFFYKL